MDAQTKQIEKLLKRRWVTAMDALKHAQCFRLAARIHDLKAAGVEIHDRWVETDSGKRVKAYRIL